MLSDVITAVATPAGRAAIAMVRLAGSGAHDVAAKVLQPFEVDPARQARRCRVVHPLSGESIDDAVYVCYRQPASYTGEDLVEISTHGGLLVPAETVAAFMAAGARVAAPGEFTRRAVLNGKMDLLQAEAVGDLIDATAPAQRRAALGQLDRNLSLRVEGLRDDVLALEALVCYEIDFPEEDSGPIAPARVDEAIDRLLEALRGLAATSAEGERLREGAIAVIAGRPNVGKSSIFNALLGSERAIVTEVPGTTRDAIEAPVTCDGFPLRLVDTAGLRNTHDRVERMGIEVSHRYLESADVIMFCAPAGEELNDDERAFLAGTAAPAILVRTKADLVASSPTGDEGLLLSAVTGMGIPELRTALATFAFAGLAAGGDVELLVTRERHRLALGAALHEIEAFRDARAEGVEGAVAAVHLRTAIGALEDVIGIVTGEDVLDRVFATFCIGK